MSEIDNTLFRCFDLLATPQNEPKESDAELCACKNLYEELFNQPNH